MPNRKRKCKLCKKYISDFVVLPVGVFCSYEKAIEYTKTKEGQKRVKTVKKKVHAKKKKEFYENDTTTQKRLAQTAFNNYIRYRDRNLPCHTCGATSAGQWDAGHYKTVGAHPELRFEPDNCHKQCSQCNNFGGGGLHPNYRPNLIKKIGKDRVLALEKYRPIKKMYASDYVKIKKKFQAMLRELKKAEGK